MADDKKKPAAADLAEIRKRINEIDERLQSLINERAVLAQKVGVQHIHKVARRLGLTGPMAKDLSIALGTSDVSLLSLTSAYASFANGGLGVIPYGIVEIRNRTNSEYWALSSSLGKVTINFKLTQFHRRGVDGNC